MLNNGRMLELPLQSLSGHQMLFIFFFFADYEDVIHSSVDHLWDIF